MRDSRLSFVAFFVTYGINSCILARRLMHTRQEGTTIFFLERVPSYSTLYNLKKRLTSVFRQNYSRDISTSALISFYRLIRIRP